MVEEIINGLTKELSLVVEEVDKIIASFKTEWEE